jgi:Reverse transcriptase (RNA-dependent DNA polymerase)
LVKVFNLLMAADGIEESVLRLLDLTTAFNSVDHHLLLQLFEYKFDVVGRLLEWFGSYLTDRTFHVVHRASSSSAVKLTCSVPQGSVLGPILFILHTAELHTLATSLGERLQLQAFADDTQLYLHCKPMTTGAVFVTFSRCLEAIKH